MARHNLLQQLLAFAGFSMLMTSLKSGASAGAGNAGLSADAQRSEGLISACSLEKTSHFSLARLSAAKSVLQRCSVCACRFCDTEIQSVSLLLLTLAVAVALRCASGREFHFWFASKDFWPVAETEVLGVVA